MLPLIFLTYFPKAKHSKVMFWPTRAVVSGNFTLRSAGYFLLWPKRKNKQQTVRCVIVFLCILQP